MESGPLVLFPLHFYIVVLWVDVCMVIVPGMCVFFAW